MRSLIRANADVNFRGPKFGNTALSDAASRGYLAVAHLLIGAGAEVDAKDIFGWTAMHHAAHAGQLEVCCMPSATPPSSGICPQQ